MSRLRLNCGFWLALVLASLSASALRADASPARVGVDERIGAALPRELRVTDQAGRSRRLEELLLRDRPTLLALAYYHCPGLCDVSLRELATRVRDSGWVLGRDFQALTVSIDPHDTPAGAGAKRASVLTLLRTPAGEAWPFVVAQDAVIQQLTAALGYRYEYDPATRQYAHPPVSLVLTPAGAISRYLYGPTLDPRSVQLALREARAGRGGASALVDRTILSCFRYDPNTHRYEWLVLGVLRSGSALIACALAAAILFFVRRGRARRSAL